MTRPASSTSLQRSFVIVLLASLQAACTTSERDRTLAAAPDSQVAAELEAAAPAAGVDRDTVEAASESWTAGRTAVEREPVGVATLQEVRAARHDDFDRVVFVFAGGAPSYTIEYVDRPVRACGSGDTVELAGDGWLSVTFNPARAHTEAGEATITERDMRPGLPVVKQLRVTCDFEAYVTWVLGVGSPNRYRVMELHDPLRLVVDIAH